MQIAHINWVHTLEKETFSIPWTVSMIHSEICSEIAYYLVAELDGILVGYGGEQIVVDEAHVTNIAVSPFARRQGVASAILSNLIAHALERGCIVMNLEVRASNLGAQALYRSYGFVPVGERKDYYHKPLENALLMDLNLTEASHEHSGN
jgi:ribosomal-protein-alanine N-acetyltransferase